MRLAMAAMHSITATPAQDQNLLQFFLAMVEWGMNVQQAAEGHGNVMSYQMQSSFGAHQAEPGRIQVPADHVTPLKGSKLWQVALMETWLQTHGV